MARNDRTTAGPYWTRNWIEKMWRFTAENFVDFDTGAVDFEALGREEYEFRKALFYRKFKNSERAREAFVESEDLYKVNVERGKKGGRPRKNQETTADGDIREDSQAKPDWSAITRNETRAHDALEPSANIYATRQANNGDAATREGAEAANSRESGALAPTTVSRNMRRVPQTEAPAHGFSGGRTAQGTMSRSPEAAAQSGKAYDKETDQVSTDEDRQSQARESRRTGGSSVRGMAKVAQHPVRSLRLPTWDEFTEFMDAQGLDYTDAREWWEMTMVDRKGLDRYGKPIANWKGALKRFCTTKTANRRTA